MAVLTGAFLRFKLSRVLRHTNGRDGSPIKNDYSFLINRKSRKVKGNEEHAVLEKVDDSDDEFENDIGETIIEKKYHNN